jgi:hypothetical protein
MKKDDFPSTDQAEIASLRDKLRSGKLNDADLQLLDRLLGTLLHLITLLHQKNASIKRLKRWLFGPRSDSRTQPKEPSCEESNPEPSQHRSSQDSSHSSSESKLSSGRKSHGRRPHSSYLGAKTILCTDPELKAGDGCPGPGCSGHLYDTRSPSILIRFTGQPLIAATRFEQQVLRCSACQDRFTAPLPAQVEPQKYDPSADVAVAMAKYGAGLPFYRLARMQSSFGVPLSQANLFERCEALANSVLPIFLHLKKLAAQAEVLFADDTKVKILSLLKENKELTEKDRRSMQTSGIVARLGERKIVLFASGRAHAGENLNELLQLRKPGLAAPIQMSDALASNFTSEFETIVAKCLAHARRHFVEIESAFPIECKSVLDGLAQVYGFEAQTKEMNPVERLLYHQQWSAPVMRGLREWIEGQVNERLVEPNSSLGKAFAYVLNHWEGLTRFLSVEGAPLDNNTAERALKLVVLHRKNALFYKTEHGASVADILMSIIETCRENGVSAWEYLVKLVRFKKEVRLRPEDYLPWNYKEEDEERQVA